MNIAVEPPKILASWGIVKDPKERWVLEGALYGLRVAPRAWQLERDTKLAVVAWVGPKRRGRRFARSRLDPSVWMIVEAHAGVKDFSASPIVAMMCTYVDDILCFGPPAEVDAAISGVQSVWATSTPSRLMWGSGNTLKFCGVWITDCRGAGFRVHQTDFVREL